MMQTPKTSQFTRKPRKQLSRDRKQMGAFLGSRQKSKESQERKQVYQNSPNKPHQLISNLRFQLTNLRQEVAKLSKRQSKRPVVRQQVRQEYEGRSPKQPKQAYSYYFDQVKSTLPQEEIVPTKSEQRVRSKSKAKVDDNASLRQKMQQIQVKNSELVKANNELNERIKEMGERLRREYDNKIHQIQNQKERLSRQKEAEENDRTINYQKQVLDNKKFIEELKDKINTLTKDNNSLKSEVQKYKRCHSQLQQKELLLIEKESRVCQLTISIQTLRITIQQMKQELIAEKEQRRLQNEQRNTLNKEIKENISTIEEFKMRLQNTSKKNMQLQKKLLAIKGQNQQQQKRKTKPLKGQIGQDTKQLHEIIAVQQKSLVNQQSDINYLQGELRKLTFLKHMNKVSNNMVDSLNEQIMTMNMSYLNRKYLKQ